MVTQDAIIENRIESSLFMGLSLSLSLYAPKDLLEPFFRFAVRLVRTCHCPAHGSICGSRCYSPSVAWIDLRANLRRDAWPLQSAILAVSPITFLIDNSHRNTFWRSWNGFYFRIVVEHWCFIFSSMQRSFVVSADTFWKLDVSSSSSSTQWYLLSVGGLSTAFENFSILPAWISCFWRVQKLDHDVPDIMKAITKYENTVSYD